MKCATEVVTKGDVIEAALLETTTEVMVAAVYKSTYVLNCNQ